MTGRRAVPTYEQRVSRALQFVPGHVGGRVASAQPIRRRGGTLRRVSVGAAGAATGAATFVTVGGSATADGGTTTFSVPGAATFTTLGGSATADGGTSAFDGQATFTSTGGSATADGGSSTFTATTPSAGTGFDPVFGFDSPLWIFSQAGNTHPALLIGA